MQKESSIFDEDFLEEFSIRRRKLMPVELKVFVWLYMIVAGLISLRLLYYYVMYPWGYGIRYRHSNILGLLAESWIFIFFTLRFLASLLLWLEKKWAVRLAVISVVLSILLSGYFFIRELLSEEFQSTSVIVLICWLAIEVPYLILLLKIKRPWETTVVPGKK